MRWNWLESRVASIIFFCSAVELTILFALFLLAFVPGVADFVNHSRFLMVFVVLWISLVCVGIPSTLILFFGMALFCLIRGTSWFYAKVLWFILFFFSGPIGSLIYYFAVYRKYVKQIAMAAPGASHLGTWETTFPTRHHSAPAGPNENSPG